MTVSVDKNRIRYVGNDSAESFAYDFRIFDDSDLQVSKVELATGTQTELLLNIDYTVTGKGVPEGGTVDFIRTDPDIPNPLLSGYVLVILRSLPLTQETVYTEGDKFPAKSHEDALDRLTMICQQLNSATITVIDLLNTNLDDLKFEYNESGYWEIRVGGDTSHPIVFSFTGTPAMKINSVGSISLMSLPTYTDNADAVIGGLNPGDLYRIGDILGIVH